MVQERNKQRHGGRLSDLNAIGRHGLAASLFALLLFGCVGETGPDPVGGNFPTDRWTVTNLSGGELGWREGAEDWRTLSIGTTLSAASELRTGTDSAAVLVRGGDTITVAENSLMAVPAATADSPVTRIMQSAGTLFFQVEKRPTPHFQVTTPYLVATVKGTTFSVSVSTAAATVSVEDGVVGVAENAGAPGVDVTAGLSATSVAGVGVSVSPTTQAPAAPSISPGARGTPGTPGAPGRSQAQGQAQGRGQGQAQGQGQGPGNSANSNAGGNSGNSNAGGNSGNSNAGGNSGGDNGNTGDSNAGGNSGNSNAGGNSGNSNAGGNSGNSNAGGNSGNDNSNAGGNSGNSNAGGNSGNSNAGGNSGNDNSNAGGNPNK